MQRSNFIVGLFACAALHAALTAGEPGKNGGQPPNDFKKAEAAFARLKQLAGEWQPANPPDEASRGKTVLRYRVTAGGSALVETVFPDQPHEMITVYHLDGDRLVLTHYCHCGNQPRMRARLGDRLDELVFEFDGGGNLNPAKDTHMHNYRVRFVDADHLHGEWELYIDGKSDSKHTFDLVRKK